MTFGLNEPTGTYRVRDKFFFPTSSLVISLSLILFPHISSHLLTTPPDAPKYSSSSLTSHYPVVSKGLETILSHLAHYKVDPIRGFLPQNDPLQRLTYARYHIWEDLGDDLSKLLVRKDSYYSYGKMYLYTNPLSLLSNPLSLLSNPCIGSKVRSGPSSFSTAPSAIHRQAQHRRGVKESPSSPLPICTCVCMGWSGAS